MKYQKPYDQTDPNASYVNGNPSSGIQGSIPPAEAIEQPQREITNAIIAAGLTPSNVDMTQLAQAIGKGSVYFASDTTNTNTYAATVSPAITALSDGMLFEWTITDANTSQTVTVNASGLGAKALVHTDGSLPMVGEVGGKILFAYDAGLGKYVLFSTKKYIDSLSPKGASSGSAFTANLVASDTSYGTDGTTTIAHATLSQSLALPLGTTWVQAQGANSLQNQNTSTTVGFTTWIVLTGSDSSLLIGPYIGGANINSSQTPLVCFATWNNLNPAVTYTLKLYSQKGTNAGPVPIYDARITALYGA